MIPEYESKSHREWYSYNKNHMVLGQLLPRKLVEIRQEVEVIHSLL